MPVDGDLEAEAAVRDPERKRRDLVERHTTIRGRLRGNDAVHRYELCDHDRAHEARRSEHDTVRRVIHHEGGARVDGDVDRGLDHRVRHCVTHVDSNVRRAGVGARIGNRAHARRHEDAIRAPAAGERPVGTDAPVALGAVKTDAERACAVRGDEHVSESVGGSVGDDHVGRARVGDIRRTRVEHVDVRDARVDDGRTGACERERPVGTARQRVRPVDAHARDALGAMEADRAAAHDRAVGRGCRTVVGGDRIGRARVEHAGVGDALGAAGTDARAALGPASEATELKVRRTHEPRRRTGALARSALDALWEDHVAVGHHDHPRVNGRRGVLGVSDRRGVRGRTPSLDVRGRSARDHEGREQKSEDEAHEACSETLHDRLLFLVG